MKAEIVRFLVDKENAPYVQTKPFHKSQKLIEELEDGTMSFEIKVVINQELQREFFGYADTIKILSPKSLVDFMGWKFRLAKEKYNNIGE